MMNYEIPAIEAKIADLKKLKAEKEELEALIASLEDEIKSSMGNDEELIAGPFKVTYKFGSQTRFDSKAFKADYPEAYTRYSKTIATRTFRVA